MNLHTTKSYHAPNKSSNMLPGGGDRCVRVWELVKAVSDDNRLFESLQLRATSSVFSTAVTSVRYVFIQYIYLQLTSGLLLNLF